MSKKGNTEFVRTELAERNVQTLIEGNKVVIKPGDEIKLNYYKWDEKDARPVSADIYVNEELVGWMKIEEVDDLLTELFDNPKSLRA
jgi:hypothetical protein